MSIKDNLDPQAMDVYMELYDKFVESGGDLGAATVWRVKVNKGVSPDDIGEALKSAALGTGLLEVGQLPLSKEIEARTGQKQRYLHMGTSKNRRFPVTSGHLEKRTSKNLARRQ